MTDWTIGALMGAWLALVLLAAVAVMRSNRLTQDACARLMSALERTQASNSRVETAYASWRSEAVTPETVRPAPAAADGRTFSHSMPPPAAYGSASGTTA